MESNEIMKINYHSQAWQCPICELWRYVRGTGRRLSKCVRCNLTVDLTVVREYVQRIEYKIQSVKFARKGKKRGK